MNSPGRVDWFYQETDTSTLEDKGSFFSFVLKIINYMDIDVEKPVAIFHTIELACQQYKDAS